MIVYKITNLINGKVYIGQTRQALSTRWRQHKSKRSNTRGLKGAIEKYGVENFTIETLHTASSKQELDAAESKYIKEYNSLVPNGYNLTTGGEGGYVRSEQTRNLLSEACKGKGRKHSETTKRLISSQRMGASNPMFGRQVSPETRAKRSASLKGHPVSPETRAKISAGHKLRQAKNNKFPTVGS